MTQAITASLHHSSLYELPHTRPQDARETIAKATRVALQLLALIGGVACFAIGFTITPFIPPVGASFLALSAVLFGISGFFLKKEFSNRPS